MKNQRLLHLLLALSACATAYAQRPQPREDRRPPPVPPFFAMLDTDHDGALSTKEMRAAGRSLEKLDTNGDNQVTLDELHGPPPPDGKAGPKDPPPGGKPPHPPVNEALDTDHDDTISAAEIEKAQESLKTLDENGDGELSPDELRRPATR